MRTHTASVEIAAAPAAILAIVSDVEQLPRWAVGFARAVERGPDGAVAITASGDRLPVAVHVDQATGVVDFDVAGVPAYTRAVAAGDKTVYTFTMLQPPGMPGDAFDAQIVALGHELVVLKSIAEVACPL